MHGLTELQIVAQVRTVVGVESPGVENAVTAWDRRAVGDPMIAGRSSSKASVTVRSLKRCATEFTLGRSPAKNRMSLCSSTKSGPTACVTVSPRFTDVRYSPSRPRRPACTTVRPITDELDCT